MAKTGYTTQQLTVLQFGDFAEQQRKIMAGVHAGQANIKAERESQKALQDKENKWVVDQYARVGELPEIGSATFDQNKDDFFNDQIDKYIKIKVYVYLSWFWCLFIDKRSLTNKFTIKA